MIRWGDPWGTAYFGGGIITSPDTPWPFAVALNGRPFMMDLVKYSEETVDQLRDARDQTAEPGEQSISTTGAWKRTRADWSLGAGQEWADDQLANARRFWHSKWADVWTPHQVCPLPALDEVMALTNVQSGLLAVGDYVYATTDNDDLYYFDNFDAASPTAHNLDSGGVLPPLTTDGAIVIYADGTGIRKTTVGSGSHSAFGGAASTYVPSLLYQYAGYLLAAKSSDSVISSVAAAGTVTTLYTHGTTAFRWTAATGTPFAIYAGGNVPNDTGEIYRWIIKDDGTLPTAPLLAGSLPRGEQLYALHYVIGAPLLVIGTSKGVRTATIENDGRLSIGPVVATGSPVRTLWAEAEFCWFGWSNYDSLSSGVGRLNLSTLVAENQPAWATDLMTGAGGATLQTGLVDAVVRFKGRTAFTVRGAGLYREAPDGEMVPAWSVEHGKFTWSAFEQKTWLGAELVHDPLTGSISILAENDRGEVVAASATRGASQQGSTGGGLDVVGGSAGAWEWVNPTVLWSTTDTDQEPPCLRRMTMRAIPLLRQASRYMLPLMLFDTVNYGVGDGYDEHLDTHEAYIWLKNLELAKTTITAQWGEQSVEGTISTIAIPDGQVSGWNDDRSWFRATVFVTILGHQV